MSDTNITQVGSSGEVELLNFAADEATDLATTAALDNATAKVEHISSRKRKPKPSSDEDLSDGSEE